jgi:hypothetical protein
MRTPLAFVASATFVACSSGHPTTTSLIWMTGERSV